MLGISQGAYEAALEYTQSREQFGKPISHYQGVQFQLAEMRTQLEATRLLVYNAARLKTLERFVSKPPSLSFSLVQQAITSKTVELFGGNGFTTEYPAEKYYRDAKIGQIYEGTTNMQLQTIAKMEPNKDNLKIKFIKKEDTCPLFFMHLNSI